MSVLGEPGKWNDRVEHTACSYCTQTRQCAAAVQIRDPVHCSQSIGLHNVLATELSMSLHISRHCLSRELAGYVVIALLAAFTSVWVLISFSTCLH